MTKLADRTGGRIAKEYIDYIEWLIGLEMLTDACNDMVYHKNIS